MHTHGNVLASLDPMEKEIGKYLRYERFVHPLRILHTLPLSHVFGQFMGLWVPSLLGAEVHFEDRLQAPRLARLIHEERISGAGGRAPGAEIIVCAPGCWRSFQVWLSPWLPPEASRSPGDGGGFARCTAAWVSSSGLLSPAALLCRRIWRFSGQRLGFALIQGYGMTETTALVTLNHPFKIARGSIGKPLAGREVRIGADGEILVRGASIAAQVWRNGGLETRSSSEEGVSAEEPGWLATGDLASRNADGDLVFAGRKSDVIVSSAGLNIHPQDLEAVLRKQPGLRGSLVVPYDSPAGPSPVAVLIPGTSETTLQGAVGCSEW